MIPESKLINREILVRDMVLNEEVKLTKKSLIRWLALSLGLISPNESRKSLLTLLEILFTFHLNNVQPTTKEIIEEINKIEKVDDKTVYYHLSRLKERGIVKRKNGKYMIGDGLGSLSEVIKRAYVEEFNNAFKKIEEALEAFEKR